MDNTRPIEESIRPDQLENNETPQTLEKLAAEFDKTDSTQDENPKNISSHLLPGISIAKTKDENTLIDVHVNNPLKRVLELLEEIKKQKAFSFTLKGSLGIMGVFLALSVFGIFGGGKMLCEKGLQTRSGELRVLALTEEATDPTIPWTKAMLQRLFGLTTTTLRHRTVLLQYNEPPIHLQTLLIHKPESLNGKQVLVTGDYNSCSSTLTLHNEKSLESMY